MFARGSDFQALEGALDDMAKYEERVDLPKSSEQSPSDAPAQARVPV